MMRNLVSREGLQQLMQSPYNHFNFQISAHQLNLNLHYIPFKLKLILKYNKNSIQTKSITIKQKVTSISEIFSFDSDLQFKKSREKGRIYMQRMVNMHQYRYKSNSQETNSKRASRSESATQIQPIMLIKTSFTIKTNLSYQSITVTTKKHKSQLPQNSTNWSIKSNNKTQGNVNRELSISYSIPRIEPLSFLKNKKVLAVSRIIQIQDEDHSSQTFNSKANKSNKSNKTFPEDSVSKQQQQVSQNVHLASKLEGLYNKLQSIAQYSPSKINGIEVIKQSPEQCLQSSAKSSRNIDSRYRQLEMKHNDLRQKYQELVSNLKDIAVDRFQLNEVISIGESSSGKMLYNDSDVQQ